MVNVEFLRITQAADLAAIPVTEADMIIQVDRATAIVTGTIPLPANPINGQIFIMTTRVDINNLTLDTNARAISGAQSTLNAGDSLGWIYNTVSDRWTRYTNPGSNDTDLLLYQALGSTILAETAGQKLQFANTSTVMVDNQIKYSALYLPKDASIAGIKVYVRVLGNYTGDNNNKVGLYSFNQSSGLLTLVASSNNSASLWTSAANAIQTIAFSAAYLASPGVYFTALLYNQSAQVAAPALASGVALNNAAMAGTAFGFANSAKLYGTSTGNDLPATIASSAITASTIPSWTAIYAS